jgi:F0F1-type ATP synthase assembly protein I
MRNLVFVIAAIVVGYVLFSVLDWLLGAPLWAVIIIVLLVVILFRLSIGGGANASHHRNRNGAGG